MTALGSATLVRPEHSDPLWLQAVDYVLALIADGSLPAGARLPAERELCAHLSISRVTLRKALGKLVDDGVLKASHGRGWYVADSVAKDWPNSLESFSETAERMGLTASSRILRSEVTAATLDEAEELAIAPGTPVFHLERVRMLDGVPIAIDDSHVVASLVDGLAEVDFRVASLYERLAGAGLDLHRADSTIEAMSADAYLSENLSIEPGKPVLVMHQVVVTAAEHPVLVSTIRYAGERYRLRTSFSRVHSLHTKRSPS